MTIDRLPKSAGGRCEPMRLSKEQIHDFVICGWVADEPVADAEACTEPDNAENSDDASGAGDTKRRRPGTVENRKLPWRDIDVEISDEEDDEDDDSEAVAERRQGIGSEAFDTKAPVEGRDISRGSRRHPMKQRRHSNLPPDLASGNAGRKGEGTPRRSSTFRNLFGKNSKDGSMNVTPPAVPTLSRSSSMKERRLTVDVSGHAAGVGSGSGSTSSAAQERSGDLSRRSPGRNRPFASPGPRGVGSGRGGGSSRGRVDSQREDFDGRLVDRALEMSINRKVRKQGERGFCVGWRRDGGVIGFCGRS